MILNLINSVLKQYQLQLPYEKASKYDQQIPRPHTADQPSAP